ncbi:MAG: hypothetical protein LBF22_04190, partial [Deltaproteobacteria bacterium]|nr:hypothetical protein [Deltaproteobacteria bacterium]
FQKQAASIAIKNGLNFVLDDSLAETDFSRWVKNEFPSYFLTPSPQKPKIDPSRLSSDPPVRGYFPHKKTKDDTLLPSIFRPLKDKIVPRPGFRISITSRLSSLIASDPPVASSQNPSPPPQETKDNPLRPSSDPPIRKKLTRIYSSSSDPPDAKNLVPSPPTAALSLYISQNKEDVSEDNAKIPLNSKTSPLTPPDSRPYSSDVKKPVSSPPPPPPPSAPPAPQGKTEPQIEKKAVSLAESVPSPPISGLAQKKVDADPGPAPPSVPPKPATQLPVEPPEKASSPPPPPTPSPPPPPPPSSPSPQLPLPSKTPKQVFPVLVLSCLGRVFPCDADNLDGLVSEYIKDGKELAFYSKNTGSLALVDRGSDLLLFSQDKAALRDSYNYIIKKCNNYSYQVDPKYSDSPFMGALSDSVGLWVKSNNNLSLRNLFFSTYVSLKKKVEDADSLKPILRLYGDNTKIVVPHFLWDYLDGPYFSESSSKGYFFPKSSYDDVSPPAVLALGANFIDLYPHDSRKLDSYSLVDTFLITSSYRWPGKGLLIEGDPCWLDVAGSVAKELAGKGLHVNFSSLPVAGGSSPKTVPPSLPSHPSPPSSKRGRRPK